MRKVRKGKRKMVKPTKAEVIMTFRQKIRNVEGLLREALEELGG